MVSVSTATAWPRPAVSTTPPPGPGLDDAALLALARARPDLAWPEERDISHARNAHLTNTRAELASALLADYDWLEGDVGMQDGRVVMRHGVGDVVDLTLEQWLRVVAASGRGAKLDIKDPAALPVILALAKAAGIPEHRLIFNVNVLPIEQLRSIRAAFPSAIINLSPVMDADLTDMELLALQNAARVVGGKVMFPIRIDLFSSDVVKALRPFGRVAIWNQPRMWNPSRHEAAQLRTMGVDGMIDLRAPEGFAQHVQATAVGTAVRILGWGPVYRALEALGYL